MMKFMRLDQKLEILCAQKGWEPPHLVELMRGVAGRTSVYNWLNGVRTPDLKAGLRLSREFGVPMEYLAEIEPH